MDFIELSFIELSIYIFLSFSTRS